MAVITSGWLMAIACAAFLGGCILQSTAPVEQSYWMNTFWSFVIMAWGPASVPSELTLWLLTVGALEATTSLDWEFFHSRLFLLSQALEIHSVLCWKQKLKRLVWSDAVFDRKLDIIWGLEATRRLGTSSSAI
ncbi:hypothetical protein EMGR_005426 [Emarellia grisea]